MLEDHLGSTRGKQTGNVNRRCLEIRPTDVSLLCDRGGSTDWCGGSTDFAHLNHNVVHQHLGISEAMGLVWSTRSTSPTSDLPPSAPLQHTGVHREASYSGID